MRRERPARRRPQRHGGVLSLHRRPNGNKLHDLGRERIPPRPHLHPDDPISSQHVGLSLHPSHSQLPRGVHRLREHRQLLTRIPPRRLNPDVIDTRPHHQPHRHKPSLRSQHELINRQIRRKTRPPLLRLNKPPPSRIRKRLLLLRNGSTLLSHDSLLRNPSPRSRRTLLLIDYASQRSERHEIRVTGKPCPPHPPLIESLHGRVWRSSLALQSEKRGPRSRTRNRSRRGPPDHYPTALYRQIDALPETSTCPVQ